jgi:hypothetical protein
MNGFGFEVYFHSKCEPVSVWPAHSNPSWHLTAAGRRSCNRRAARPPSLSLCRCAAITARILNRGLCILLVLCIFPWPSRAEDLRLLSLGMRAGVTGLDVIGDESPEEFEEIDAVATFKLPWGLYSESGLGAGTGLMASAGAFRGSGETAFVASLIPVLTLGSQDARFTLDGGIGGALLSKHQFGTQDFGGPFQFALTLGANVPLYKRLGVGYRFLHYSDAGIHAHSTGADLHMIEFTYRF